MKPVFFAFLLLPALAFAQQSQAYLNYIEQYHELAIKQQEEHKIPASITLAQGILESGAGQGRLAVKANNHFGIKCHDWDGARIYHDDDKRRECFRKYRRVIDSYEDHSEFLKSRSRYASLFELTPTDYKGWAHGLKKAGYATDPTYAYKLISLIDEYELHRFDLMASKDIKRTQKTSWAERRKQRKAQRKRTDGGTQQTAETVAAAGAVWAYTPHQVMRVNGLKYVEAQPGDTYGSIADEFGLSEQQVARFNDMEGQRAPVAGQRVYLQKKKRKAPKQFDTHTIQPGESLYDIAQYYGIRLIDLYDMNSLPYDAGARVGQVIKVRP